MIPLTAPVPRYWLVADPAERVVRAAPVTDLNLLDPASGLLHRLESELDDVGGDQDSEG